MTAVWPWLCRQGARLSSRISGFDSRLANAGVVMMKVTFRHGFLQDFFSPSRIIPPVIRTQTSFICSQHKYRENCLQRNRKGRNLWVESMSRLIQVIEVWILRLQPQRTVNVFRSVQVFFMPRFLLRQDWQYNWQRRYIWFGLWP